MFEANATSKLQTELGTYHLQYDEDRAELQSQVVARPKKRT